MSELMVKLKELHPAQETVLRQSKRFNVLCCGRQWGKTELGQKLIVETALKNIPTGYFAPTYKDLAEVWREVKYLLIEIIKRKDEQTKQLELIIGRNSIIDFWSMEDPNSGRGRKYGRVVIDEFEKAREGQYAWDYTIRPTLITLQGDAWILSTPRGYNTYFKRLFDYKDKFDDWMSWQMPSESNPYLLKKEIENARNTRDPISFQQEYMAEFTMMGDKPFLYSFEDKHISNELEINPKLTLHLSFDFNVDPITCIVSQHTSKQIGIMDEFRLRNSNTYELCDHIKAKYGKYYKLVTGDASGTRRNTVTKGNINNYSIILDELGISESQLMIPSDNPSINESRTLCNSLLSTFDVKIHPRCRYLIEDCRFTQVDKFGQLDKRDPLRTHLLDAMRYYFNSFFGDYLVN